MKPVSSHVGGAALLAGAVGIVGSGSALASERPPFCADLDAPRAPQAERQACGIKTWPRQRVKSLPDGGKEYEFKVENLDVSYRIPPADFDPVGASLAQRRFYGVPEEPPATDTARHDLWEKAIRSKLADPPAEILTFPVTANARSTNWSGRHDMSGVNTYNDALMRYYEPADSGTACGSHAAVMWAGLGGFSTSTLAQNGTVIGNATGIPNHTAWWEILPAGITPIYSLKAAPGGLFKAETHWMGGSYQFSFLDETTNNSAVINVGNASYDGTSADFIIERPSISGVPTALTNYGDFRVYGTIANGQTGNHWFNEGIDMYNGSRKLAAALDWDSGTTSGGFQDLWKNCS